MQLTQLVLAALTLALSADACKCKKQYGAGAEVIAATKSCCAKLHGKFVNGNDCLASSISNKLANFDLCCETTKPEGMDSDCCCPRGCDGPGCGGKRELSVRELEDRELIKGYIALKLREPEEEDEA